ncbi:cysteine-rich KTR domain-containing protein [Blautia schinkii]|nr:cysteine-rich KTR domain-containing protein [Blautia schinkii]
MKKERWILCPLCQSKTRIKAREDTILKNFPLFCPKCKHETLINIVNLKLNILTEPDAAAVK